MDTKLKFIMRLFQLLHILANQWLFNYNLIKIVVEDFVPGHPQTCLSALGSQAHTVLFSSDMGRLWVQSHIGKRSAPLMLYKCLAQVWVYHYYTCWSVRNMPWAVKKVLTGRRQDVISLRYAWGHQNPPFCPRCQIVEFWEAIVGS